MIELNEFYNDGFGWICRHCERELNDVSTPAEEPRIMHEGEAEAKSPDLSTKALAVWADRLRETLRCPRCGVTEAISKS